MLIEATYLELLRTAPSGPMLSSGLSATEIPRKTVPRMTRMTPTQCEEALSTSSRTRFPLRTSLSSAGRTSCSS